MTVALYLVGGVVGLLLVLILWDAATEPIRHKNIDPVKFRSLIEQIRIHAWDRGCMQFDVKNSEAYVRVVKRIRGDDDVTLEVRVPPSAYGRIGRDATESALAELAGASVAMGEDDRAGTHEDFVVDCGSSIDRAVVVTESILRDILGVDIRRQCVAFPVYYDKSMMRHPGFSRDPEFELPPVIRRIFRV